jgi:hypothetical protein
LGVALAAAGVAALLVPSLAARRAAAPGPEGHEFDALAVDPTAVGMAEAGVAISEHTHH